jgi:hexosaminidase
MTPIMKSLLLSLLLAWPAMAADFPAIIPLPQETQVAEGRWALISPCIIETENPADAVRLIEVLRSAGLSVAKADGKSPAHIRLRNGEVKNPHKFTGAYQLGVSADGIEITAAESAGFFYAAETLRQMITPDAGKPTVPYATIHDWPAFPVRGFLLDTGRNYQSPALLKEQIEVMARYKLNLFHFHFTDDPGWRLESKRYPKANDPASMTRQPGKFYTQQEFRDLVKFCRERSITLVPEMDMPGHSKALRKALSIESMNPPESRKILKDLLTELATLASPEEMPYIHIGTDEVREKEEKVDATFLPEMSAHVRSLGREVIGWHHGLEDLADKKRITQLWARANPLPENPFIDCRSTYINHSDPFEVVSTFLFQQSCRRPHGDATALGGMICSWPDIRIENERDQLKQNPVYPGMLAFAESIWRGVETDDKEAYWANLPPLGTPEYAKFQEFEARLLDHKARYFEGKEFPYFKQTDFRWKVIGPFPNDGDVNKVFPVESKLQESYQVDGRDYSWMAREFGAATVYLKHFFGFGAPVKEAEGTCYALTHIWSPDDRKMPSWIGFHGSSRSDRRGAGRFEQGEWHATKPWIRVNGKFIAPPTWENAGIVKDNETPFTNEDYFFREPSMIELKKGWNEVLLKIPHRKGDWKWMFTFAPIGDTRGFRYSSNLYPSE